MHKNKINISDIDITDDRFRFCYYPDLTSMIESIKRIGLVYPLVLAVREGKKIVVCGWKRLLACEKLSFSEVPAVILNEEDDLKVFDTAVFENASFRSFDSLEKAEILSKWKGFNIAENTIIKELMPLLDIPPTKEYFDLFHAVSHLDNDIKKKIAQNHMDLKTVSLYLELTPASRQDILPFLLSLGQNKQRELLSNLVEIILKEDIPSDMLLGSKDIETIMNLERLPVRQRAEKLALYLKKRRYPLLSNQMNRFDYLSKKTGLKGKNIDVKASDYFEGEGMTLSFSVKDSKDYNKKVKALTELAVKKELTDLFKLLSNEDE